MKQPKIYYIKSNYLPIFRAIALPYIGIIIKEKYRDDKILIEHETIHLKQMKRMTFLVYIIRYIVQLIFIGYDTMPMELEARQTDISLWNYRERNWKKKSKITDELKIYLKNTSKEQINIDWESTKKYDDISPTIDDFIKTNKQ